MPRILIVDDDANLRAAIRRMLAPTGYEIEEAANGRDALRAFRARAADLVLCDVFMPERDGLELLGELSRGFVGAKVVSMSGGLHGRMDLLPFAKSLGAVAVLYKPFERTELLEVVAWALAQPPA